MSYFLAVVGMALLIEGLPSFISPARVKEIARKLPEMPDSVIRMIGFIMILTGLVLAYVGTRGR